MDKSIDLSGQCTLCSKGTCIIKDSETCIAFQTGQVSLYIYHSTGLVAITLKVGVNISSLPDSIRDDAATCRTEWTLVEPLGTIEMVSMADSNTWVAIRPVLDIRKLWKEQQPLPSKKEYLCNKNTNSACTMLQHY